MVLNNITHILNRFVVVNQENSCADSLNMCSGQNETPVSENNQDVDKSGSHKKISLSDCGIHDCSKSSSQIELTQIFEKQSNYESFHIDLTDDEEEETKDTECARSSSKDSIHDKLVYMTQVNTIQFEECARAQEAVEVLLEANICLEKELKELIVSHEEECRMLRNEINALKKTEVEMNKELFVLRKTIQTIEQELNVYSEIDHQEVSKRKINEINEEDKNDDESTVTTTTKKARLEEKSELKSSKGATTIMRLEKVKHLTSSDIEIVDHRLETKSIVLLNQKSEPFDLGDWQLISYLNGNEAIRYKFHKASEIGPNRQIILWSRFSTEKRHFPPNDFTIGNLYRYDMREIFVWEMLNDSDVITDALYDSNGIEVLRTDFKIKKDSKA